ncbi:hypothetical protein EXU57_06680 [Segetibacter sp. 3557_3]|uniref:IPT/TIG domain-containing protein n=1 Tax=Segetibacter sp. 3557_3 TaxID=2547429 RepID=UPI001058F669|nr:IPT/TIG domain-containing protein [Segetibacter sp. 3557_3]TDH27270.1 hypothetical protein EXU57_06680 [Segetibacter sp. 3557_3]
MKIVVKERQYEFDPEFPHGWTKSSNHHYKPAVEIGSYQCFIKRYHRQTAESLPGWNLLLQLKGKFEPNLPRVQDVVLDSTNDGDFYYVIYDMLHGDTLSRVIDKNIEVNLQKLTDDIISAILSLAKRNYYNNPFSDDDIFYDRNRNFYITGFENASSSSPGVTAGHAKSIYRQQVLRFYQTILHDEHVSDNDLNGASVNLLELVFLVMRLKVFYSNKQYGYHSSELLANLAYYLNETSIYFKDLFIKVKQNGATFLKADEIGMLSDLIVEKIVNTIHVPRLSVSPLQVFTVSDSSAKHQDDFIVESGKPFTLHWTLHNAGKAELYRNHMFYKLFGPSDNDVTVKENYDGKDKRVSYTLKVPGESGAHEKTLMVIVTPSKKPAAAYIENLSIKNIEPVDGEYVVPGNQAFELSWKADGAESAELYRNGIVYEVLNPKQNSIVLREGYDGKDRKVEYALRIAKGEDFASELLNVKVISPARRVFIDHFEVVNYLSKNGDNYIVVKGKPIKLSWVVRNAETVELFRNEQLYRTISPGTNTIELNEANEVTGKIDYTLQVTNSGEVEMKSVAVSLKHQPSAMPKISSFLVDNFVRKNDDNYAVDLSQPVRLTWEIEGADKLEIHRNGRPWKKVAPTANRLEVIDKFEPGQSAIRYALLASANGSEVAQKELSLVNGSLTQKKPQRARKFPVGWLLLLFVVLLAAVAAIFIIRRPPSAPAFSALNVNTISRGQVIGIAATNLSKADTSVQVMFNQVPAERIDKTEDSLLVTVPDLNIDNLRVDVNVVLNGKTFDIAKNLVYKGQPLTTSWSLIPISRTRVFENDTIVIYGQNIPFRALELRFNDISGQILSGHSDSMKVVVPKLPAATTEVNLVARTNDETIMLAEHVPYKKGNPVVAAIMPLRKDKVVANQVITMFGKNLPTSRGAVRITFNGVRADLLTVTKDRVLALVPTLPAGTTQVNILAALEGVVFTVAQNMPYEAAAAPIQEKIVQVQPLRLSALSAGQTITLSGVNLPADGGVEVHFNDSRGKIISQTADNITVQVPSLTNTQSVRVTVTVNGKTFPLETLAYNGPATPTTVINLREQVTVVPAFDSRFLGGINDLKVTVTNKSSFTILHAVVEVSYQRKNGKVLNTAQLTFDNIKPNSSQEKDGPKHDKGAKVTTRLISVSSKEFGNQ